jgi:hypothetical protein
MLRVRIMEPHVFTRKEILHTGILTKSDLPIGCSGMNSELNGQSVVMLSIQTLLVAHIAKLSRVLREHLTIAS